MAIRFRADYRRTIIDEEDGDTLHTITYPTSDDLFPASKSPVRFALQSWDAVGTVREYADRTASAYVPNGELIDHCPTADAAIDALIKHDQARHNQ